MELCKGGSLCDILHVKEKKVNLSLKQKIIIIIQIVEGLIYLHQNNTLHRDLKTLNILLLKQINGADTIPHIKIADFGLSKIFDNSQSRNSMTGGVGTPHYSAPEVNMGSSYGAKSDIYSLGIIIWELFSETYPYSDLGYNNNKIYFDVGMGKLRPSLNLLHHTTPQKLKDIITRCWSQEPEDRPQLEDIYAIVEYLS